MEFDKFSITYMNPGTCFYREVQFKQEYCNPVCVRFTNTEAVVLGDYGSWVFQGNIREPLTFFAGNHINPGYWHEKLEAAPRDHYYRNVDARIVREELVKIAEDHNINVKDTETLMAPRESPEAWYDYLREMREDLDWRIYDEDIISIIDSATEEDGRYLCVCEFLQKAANIVMEREPNGIAEPKK